MDVVYFFPTPAATYGLSRWTMGGRLGLPKPLLLPDANAPSQKREIPAGLAISKAGQLLYVVGNLGNRLYEIEVATQKVLRSWETGVAPYDVVLAGGKAYVSNLGGRRPGKDDPTAPAGKGTRVRVDPSGQRVAEGSVTIINLSSGQVLSEIPTGLHASALAVSPNGRYVVVANAGSDTLHVIEVRTDRVVEKIWARQTPADVFGAQPNAMAFDPSGRKLYVCNGTAECGRGSAVRAGGKCLAGGGIDPCGMVSRRGRVRCCSSPVVRGEYQRHRSR